MLRNCVYLSSLKVIKWKFSNTNIYHFGAYFLFVFFFFICHGCSSNENIKYSIRLDVLRWKCHYNNFDTLLNFKMQCPVYYFEMCYRFYYSVPLDVGIFIQKNEYKSNKYDNHGIRGADGCIVTNRCCSYCYTNTIHTNTFQFSLGAIRKSEFIGDNKRNIHRNHTIHSGRNFISFHSILKYIYRIPLKHIHRNGKRNISTAK